MSADTNAKHISETKVASLGVPEEELAAEDSPIRDCVPGQSFKLTTASTCLLPL
jgi:hypothetical protein